LGLGPDTNPYRYGRNDPVGYVDPTGLSWTYYPGMGSVYVTLGPSASGFQAVFTAFFKPDSKVMQDGPSHFRCKEIQFVLIARVTVNGGTIGKGKDWGLNPWNPPIDKWFVDAEKPPYYPTEHPGNLVQSPYPALLDSPGPTLGLWKLQNISYEFEDAVVCSKGTGRYPRSAEGQVYGTFKWGFSYTVAGPFWNRHPVARKMYINNIVWTDAEKKTVVVKGLFGNEERELGGVSMWGFKGYISLEKPSGEMKKVLAKYF
jgi:hypothetical protein